MSLGAAACGGDDDSTSASTASADVSTEAEVSPETTIESVEPTDDTVDAEVAELPGDATELRAPEAERGEEAFALSEPADSDAAATSAGGFDGATDEVFAEEAAPEAVTDVQEQQLGLRAGSVDDNADFAGYLDYQAEFAGFGIPVGAIDVSGRQIVQVRDAEQQPVIGATVRILDADGAVVDESRTYSNGQALVFVTERTPLEVDDDQSRTQDQDQSQQQQQPERVLSLEVTKGGQSVVAELDPRQGVHAVNLDVGSTQQVTELDVLFLIDTTGSMDDEIARLRSTMVEVAQRIDALPANPDTRFGMTLYRDFGDEYLTRTVDFTSDVTDFTDRLGQVGAAGGGDEPEALDQALDEAIGLQGWRGGDAVQIVILLADAPPHIADGAEPADSPEYTDAVLAAKVKGVKIFPIASSGTNSQAEYVFRQLAQVTMGRFVFLTYGADGISPGDGTDLNVDDYSVLALDDLVVKLVADELEPRTRTAG